MAHFALIKDNVVQQIIVVNNDVLENKEFPESESIGIAFCKSIYGEDTEWLQCSYNGNFRKKYPTLGSVYNPIKNEFGSEE
jgi:hypothetical protein